MGFTEIVKNLLAVIEFGSREQAIRSVKSWMNEKYSLYVSDAEVYGACLEKLYELDATIKSRFSRKTVFDHINKNIVSLKLSDKPFEQGISDFFQALLEVEPKTLTVTAPISGIRLDNAKEFNLSIYKFGYLGDLELPICNENGMYISASIADVYDRSIAIEKAENAFLNFAKIMVFIAGKQDRSILISTGLPLRPDFTHERMYVSTSSYQISDSSGILDSAQISNHSLEKIPVNNEFFCNNPDFNKLWDLNEKKHTGGKLKDVESRLLNAAIALGESAITNDKKNSIIYTCMSLEILFSYDEGSLFQKSIGDKLSDMFTFIVAKDKETRMATSKAVKKVYGLRSAIVHGGDKALNDLNLEINVLIRAAINELINNEKFAKIKNIAQIYEQLKEAQNSY